MVFLPIEEFYFIVLITNGYIIQKTKQIVYIENIFFISYEFYMNVIHTYIHNNFYNF